MYMLLEPSGVYGTVRLPRFYHQLDYLLSDCWFIYRCCKSTSWTIILTVYIYYLLTGISLSVCVVRLRSCGICFRITMYQVYHSCIYDTFLL